MSAGFIPENSARNSGSASLDPRPITITRRGPTARLACFTAAPISAISVRLLEPPVILKIATVFLASPRAAESRGGFGKFAPTGMKTAFLHDHAAARNHFRLDRKNSRSALLNRDDGERGLGNIAARGQSICFLQGAQNRERPPRNARRSSGEWKGRGERSLENLAETTLDS